MTSITNEQREALVAAMDALLDKRRDSLTERAKRGYGDQWLTLHHFLEATTIEDAPTPDTTPLWRDRPREDWMKDGDIYLDVEHSADQVSVRYEELEIFGESIYIDGGPGSDGPMFAPAALPALIATLQELQRRLEGDTTAGEPK